VNRLLRVLLSACAVCSVTACGDDSDSLDITVFVAAPDSIGIGGSTQLVFAVNPPSAKATIDGVGDVTGQTQITVNPVVTTTYQLTATLGETSVNRSVTVTVAKAVPSLVITLPGNVNAGYPASVNVAVKDQFGNAIPNYQGTVTFTSTDTGQGAMVPAPITFAGTEGGMATTSTTFITLGSQTLSASDTGTPMAMGSAASTVHGLVYTAPTSGRVRLVANAAQSNARVVQLDLVANERLEMSSFFSANQNGTILLAGPGSFAAGMNLPLDTTRVTADTTLFTAGPALVVSINNPSPAPPTVTQPVGIGSLGTDHVLYTAVSRKRTTATNFRQATEVQAGGVFYSVRLRLTPTGTVGPVFDGTQPSPLFRAAVRDQYGDDFVSQNDIGVGKLEVR
jgi:hypothetical protein